MRDSNEPSFDEPAAMWWFQESRGVNAPGFGPRGCRFLSWGEHMRADTLLTWPDGRAILLAEWLGELRSGG